MVFEMSEMYHQWTKVICKSSKKPSSDLVIRGCNSSFLFSEDFHYYGRFWYSDHTSITDPSNVRTVTSTLNTYEHVDFKNHATSTQTENMINADLFVHNLIIIIITMMMILTQWCITSKLKLSCHQRRILAPLK